MNSLDKKHIMEYNQSSRVYIIALTAMGIPLIVFISALNSLVSGDYISYSNTLGIFIISLISILILVLGIFNSKNIKLTIYDNIMVFRNVDIYKDIDYLDVKYIQLIESTELDKNSYKSTPFEKAKYVRLQDSDFDIIADIPKGIFVGGNKLKSFIDEIKGKNSNIKLDNQIIKVITD